MLAPIFFPLVTFTIVPTFHSLLEFITGHLRSEMVLKARHRPAIRHSAHFDDSLHRFGSKFAHYAKVEIVYKNRLGSRSCGGCCTARKLRSDLSRLKTVLHGPEGCAVVSLNI